MAERLNEGARDLLADALAGAFDSGTMVHRTGTQPASADDAESGTLLVTINLPATAFGAAASGVAAKAGTWSATVAESGDAGYFRLASGDDSVRIDGDITATAGGGEIEMDDISYVAGGTVTIDTFQITQPAE